MLLEDIYYFSQIIQEEVSLPEIFICMAKQIPFSI